MTVITGDQLPSYLIGRGVLRPADVVSAQVTVRDVSSRNLDFCVEVQPGQSLFVKQATNRADHAQVQAEADWYAHRSPHLSRHIPRLVHWDPEESLLVLTLAPGEDMHAAQGWAGTSRAVATGLAECLGDLHTLHAAADDHALEEMTPGVVHLHRPGPALLRDGSLGALELVRAVQRDAPLVAGLDALRRSDIPARPVHFDVKWDNIVVGRSPTTLQLIDWEMAGLGDPAWDVGCVVGAYLSSWLYSLREEEGGSAGAAAGRPIALLRPAIQAFWDRYLQVNPEAASDGDFRTRVTRYAAARLIQTAYEASLFADRLAAPGVRHLQVASNIMAQPTLAADELLDLRQPITGVDDDPLR